MEGEGDDTITVPQVKPLHEEFVICTQEITVESPPPERTGRIPTFYDYAVQRTTSSVSKPSRATSSVLKC